MAAITFTTNAVATTKNRFVTTITAAGGAIAGTLANATILAAVPVGPLRTILATPLATDAAAYDLLFKNPKIRVSLKSRNWLAGEGWDDSRMRVEWKAAGPATPISILATSAAGDDVEGVVLEIEYRHSLGR